MALIFDIETVGEPWETLDPVSQEALTRWIKKESQNEGEYEASLAELKDGLGFSPLTGSIVAIGVLDTERSRGAVHYRTEGKRAKESEEDGIKYKPMGEREMLAEFWRVAEHYDEFVSFNGRSFDAPFLALRSLVHGLRPTKNLLAYRYVESQRTGPWHIDLLDQLTFYGALRKRPSLHLFCRALGIKSPKAGGTTGDDVARLFREGKYLELARYNAGDLYATLELYTRWLSAFR